MIYEPVAPDFDTLCARLAGPQIVQLVRERLRDHEHDSVLTLFYCTYAKKRDSLPDRLKEEDRAQVMRDCERYSAHEKATDLPLYFVRSLLPGYLEPA